LECLEEFREKQADEKEVIQALERVVKRLKRESKGEVPLTFSPTARDGAEPAPLEEVIPNELRSILLAQLSTFQVLFLETYLAEVESPDRVERMKRTAAKLGMSTSSAYEIMRNIKNVLRPLFGVKGR
jgi:hypothetical protein